MHPTITNKGSVGICGSSGSIESPSAVTVAAVPEAVSHKLELPDVPSLTLKKEIAPEPTFEQKYQSLIQNKFALSSIDDLLAKKEAFSQEDFDRLKNCIDSTSTAVVTLITLVEEEISLRGEAAIKATVDALGGEERLIRYSQRAETNQSAVIACLFNQFPQSAATLNELHNQYPQLLSHTNCGWIVHKIKNKAAAIQNVDEAIAYCRFMGQFFLGFGKNSDSLYDRLKGWYNFNFSKDITQHFFEKEANTLEDLLTCVDCQKYYLNKNNNVLCRSPRNDPAHEKQQANRQKLEEALKTAKIHLQEYLKTFPIAKIHEAILVLRALNAFIDKLKKEHCESASLHLQKEMHMTINNKFQPDGPESDIREAISKLETMKHSYQMAEF